MCEVYLEAFFFFTGLRVDDALFFFFGALVAREADKATDRSAFSAILFSHASISEFSGDVTAVTLGALGFLLNLIFGNPLDCNLAINFLVAGVTLSNRGFSAAQSLSRNC